LTPNQLEVKPRSEPSRDWINKNKTKYKKLGWKNIIGLKNWLIFELKIEKIKRLMTVPKNAPINP